MTVVISDTSLINYLVLIGEIGLLPALYRRVLIPDAVLAEMREEGSPAAVMAWSSVLPDWVKVVLVAVEQGGSTLDAGELAAINLAEEMRAGSAGGEVMLIMDDAAGRAEADLVAFLLAEDRERTS
jgi:predicted nucleic acid-binding protein